MPRRGEGGPKLAAMPRIIHTGQALVDATAMVPALPDQGQNVMAQGWSQQAGGAVNILVAAARSGAACVHAGAIGTGPNGDLIREALAQAGVEWSAPVIADTDTALCIVLVEPSGERTFVTTLGAERHLSVAALAASAPVAADLVCVTGYSLAVPSTRDPLLTWLAGLPAGVGVVVDPGAVFAGLPAEVREAVLARTTVWTSNQEEAEALVGSASMAEAATRIAALLPAGAVSIVRDGPAGCAVHAGDAVVVVPGYPQEPVDTNGAGDAHTGVLVAERAAGTDWVEACRRANVAGAIKVTRRGPATAPTSAEIDAFLAAEAAGADHATA